MSKTSYVFYARVERWLCVIGGEFIWLLTLYTDPESHKAQRYWQTDGRMDRRQNDANNWSSGAQPEICFGEGINF